MLKTTCPPSLSPLTESDTRQSSLTSEGRLTSKQHNPQFLDQSYFLALPQKVSKKV